MPDQSSEYQQFTAEASLALAGLRHRLRTILDGILPEGYGARSLGRALGIEQTTAWRCWRLSTVSDPAQVLQAMPGRHAWRKVFARLEVHGIPTSDLNELRRAFAEVEPFVFGRRAERRSLRSMAAGGLDSRTDLAALRAERRAMSRAAARLYGVQARTVRVTWMVAPGSRRNTLSLGVCGAIDGLRRQRPGPPWPVLQRSIVSEQRGKPPAFFEPLGSDAALPTLVHASATTAPGGAELRRGMRHQHETVELADVSAERNGKVGLAHAEIFRNAVSIGSVKLLPVVLATPVMIPADLLSLEIRLHRDVRRHTAPALLLYGTPVTTAQFASMSDMIRIPSEAVFRCVDGARVSPNPSEGERGFRESLRRVAMAQGAGIDDYEVHRVLLPHPILFSTAAVEFELVGGARR